jgi:hypothetical protein
LFSFTGAITFGSFAFEAKIGEVGLSEVAQTDEFDLLGIRDNSFVFGGIDSKGKATYGTGGGVTLAGFGGEGTAESSSPSLFKSAGDIKSPDVIVAKKSAPFFSQVSKFGKNGEQTYSGFETGANLKLGFLIGN